MHEARFALEDLGAEAPPEVKEAAEEDREPRADFLRQSGLKLLHALLRRPVQALSKAEEEADAAKTEARRGLWPTAHRSR